MSIPIFKIFTIFGVVSTWAETALADGKVTLTEAVALVTRLAAILGIKTELEIPTAIPTVVIDEEQPPHPDAGETEPSRARPPPKPEK